MNKVLINIIGATIILGVGASLFVFALFSDGIAHKMLSSFLDNRVTILLHFVFCTIVYSDALKRKVPYATLWYLVMIVFPVVGILLYLFFVKRPPMPESTGNERTSRLCPHCGTRVDNG